MRITLSETAALYLVTCFWGALLAAEERPTVPTEAEIFYVATAGNDAWSGGVSAPNDEKTDGPFASLSRARDAIRKLRAENRLPEGATVLVRGGVYLMPATLELTPEDSGTAGGPIVYRAFEGERPVLTGGRPIRRFVPHEGKVLKADLRAQGFPEFYFRQLFFNAQRQHLARHPNFDPEAPLAGGWTETGGKPEHVAAEIPEDLRKQTFYYPPGPVRDWKHVEDAEVVIFARFNWWNNIIAVKSIDRSKRLVELAASASYPISPGNRCYFRNVLEELDAPGEWFLDKRTWTLYFFPPDGITPNEIDSADIRAPAIDTILHFRPGTKHVVFRGFTLECCDRTAILLEDARHCLIAGNTVRNVVGYCSATLPAVFVQGGSECGVVGNDVYSVGSHGIEIAAGDRKTLLPAKLYADNNYVHHTGVFHKQGIGMIVRGVGNRLSHNLIHDCPRWGIYFADNDHVIEYNHIRHVNTETCDTGGIYGYGVDWTRRGTVIRYNYLHDLLGYGEVAGKWVTPYYAWGIYLDGITCGTTVVGNVVVRAPYGGGMMNAGRDNIWLNNIFVEGGDRQMSFSGFMDENNFNIPGLKEKYAQYAHLPAYKKYPKLQTMNVEEGWRMAGTVFKRNIISYSNLGAVLYRQLRIPDDQTVCDENLIYHHGLPLLTGGRGVPLGGQWEAWKRRGFDRNSIVADPLFVDPKSDDYRLRPESPALKLGFKPIPFDKIGPYQDDRRASWPIVEAPGVREKPVVSQGDADVLRGRVAVRARELSARKGLGNFFAKAAAGRPLKVAYFGGGYHYADGWRKQIIDRLKEQYGNVAEIPASYPGCLRGSPASVYRFRRDVLAKKPDLVLVDFACDDHGTQPAMLMRIVEGIVRQAREADPQLDVALLYAFQEDYDAHYSVGLTPPAITSYEIVAEHYGVPSINMGLRIAKLHHDGKLLLRPPKEGKLPEGKLLFSRNGWQPTPETDKIYADAIARAFQTLSRQAKPALGELPAPLRDDNFQRARLVPIDQSMLSGRWEQLPPDDPLRKSHAHYFDTIWFTNTPGAKLTFKFRGTAASVLCLLGPDTGRVRAIVDGSERRLRDPADPYSYYHRLWSFQVAEDLPDGVHTVSVELLPEKPDRSATIEAAKKNKRYQAELFDGTALRFGFIRLVGELVEE